VKRPLADLKLGDRLEGTVIRKTSEGVRLDFGYEVYGHSTNPRKEALDKLQAKQTVFGVVERVDPKARMFWVAIDGLSKGKLCRDLKEGDVVDGTVVLREKSRVKIDIGCEMTASLPDKEKTKEVFKFELGEEVKGFVVESVDGESNKVTLSLPGLSELVADRPDEEYAPKQKMKREPEVMVSKNGFKFVSLNANDLRNQGFKGVELQLSGLVFGGIDKGSQTITLNKTKDFFPGIEDGQAVKGTISNKIRNAAVYADIGAKKNAKLVDSPGALLLKWGEKVDLVVQKVHHEKGWCDVVVQGISEITAGRKEKQTELKDLEVGSIIPGRIEGKVGKSDRELWVDVGASKAARTWVGDTKLAKTLQPGAEVQVKLLDVDLNKTQLTADLHVE